MSTIEISRPALDGNGTSVVVDGIELKQSLSSVILDFHADGPPKVTLARHLVENVRLCSNDAQIVLPQSTIDLLERHGWTAPAAKAGA